MKNVLIVSLLLTNYVFAAASSNTGSSTDSSLFDPESAKFSKKETIETWVAPKNYVDKDRMKELQGCVARTVPENPFSVNFCMPIKNNQGDKRYFGKTFHTLAAIELPFLQFVHQQSVGRNMRTLELAAGMGFVSWKVPLAFVKDGKHYVNDLSEPMLRERFNPLKTKWVPTKELQDCFETLLGDCFDLPKKNPDLVGKFDAIYVQNLEHFFNPVQHQAFLTLISDLLTEGGKAFLSAHTFIFKNVATDSLRQLYNAQKKAGDMYPGFAQYDVEFIQLKGSEGVIDFKYSNIVRPTDDAAVTKTDLKEGKEDSVALVHGEPIKVIKAHQRVVANAFSPTIYRAAVAKHSSLEVIDTFFMTQDGERDDKWNDTLAHAAAIIQKKAGTAAVRAGAKDEAKQ